MRLRLTWTLPVLTFLSLAAVAVAVGYVAYRGAIDKLQEHEITDLREETRLRALTLQKEIAGLREDVMKLAHNAVVKRIVRRHAEGLSYESDLITLGAVFRDVAKLHLGNGSSADYKPYLQIALIDRTGQEIARLERQNETDWVYRASEEGIRKDTPGPENNGAGLSSLPQKDGDTDGYDDVSRTLQCPDGTVCLAGILANDNITSNTQDAVPVLRASMALRQPDGEDSGIVIINMDFERAARDLTLSLRHLVYIGDQHGNLLYGPDFRSMHEALQKQPRPDFVETVCEDFEDDGQASLRSRLEKLTSQKPNDRSPVTHMPGGVPRRQYEYTGERLMVEDSKSGTLRLREPIWLGKVSTTEDTDWAEVENLLREIGGDSDEAASVRVPQQLQPRITPWIAMRADRREGLDAALTRLTTPGTNPGLKPFYGAVACHDFFAFFVRLHFDPENPDAHIDLLQAFSLQELEYDLLPTAWNVFWRSLAATLGLALLALIATRLYITNRIKQMTAAATTIAAGDYDTALPLSADDEIGDLARAFDEMCSKVRERDAEIRRQNDDLDEKVREQTTDLREKTVSLADARDKLAAAVQSRDAFLATVSHELRTPLNHIYGYAQLLEITDLDDEQRSDLQKLQGSGRHLLRLVQDILDYQKIIMGRLPLSPVRFDITELLSTVRDSNLPKAAQRNNQLVLDLHDLQGTAFNDQHRLQQVLDNLVGNACKFTTDGTITIDGRVDGEFIEIAVTDTGVGISEEAVSKLFRPFSKVSDSSLNPDGTGLGLVISRELARKMGGDLSVTSVPRQGSTFLTHILREIPAEGDSGEQFTIESDTLTTISELRPNTATREEPLRSASKRVLVIDDDPNVRELISRFLTEEGLEVITASTGAEGIELAVRHSPSAITLDVVMPDVDGWSVLAALKANKRTADIPVVLVTVLDDPQKGYSFGATDYVAKPIEGDRLVQVVRRYCRTEAPTVLIIDDNPKDREIVRRVLKNDGCRIVEAADGLDGLAKFEESSPELVVLDLMMPVMDGFTFVEELRQRTETELPPIVVLTAKEMTAENRDRLNGMVTDVIQKGQFDRRRFLHEIHRHLDKP